jgi:hypothetical protein
MFINGGHNGSQFVSGPQIPQGTLGQFPHQALAMRHLALGIIPSQDQQYYFMAAEKAAVWNLYTELSSES